jgi:DnaJ-class molecular chaperone
MSRSRDRRKRREREAWVKRHGMRERLRTMLPLEQCSECHGSGRAPDHALRVLQDAQGLRDEAIGIYKMCRKCGGDGKVRAGMLHFNVTI